MEIARRLSVMKSPFLLIRRWATATASLKGPKVNRSTRRGATLNRHGMQATATTHRPPADADADADAGEAAEPPKAVATPTGAAANRHAGDTVLVGRNR
jgi:hypothetical protein